MNQLLSDKVVVVTGAGRGIGRVMLPSFIEEKTHLFHQRVEVRVVNEILRNETGKVLDQ